MRRYRLPLSNAAERGSVLLPVVVAIVLLASITFMLSNQAVNQTNIVSGELERDRLRYVAEAGIAHAKLELSRNTSCDNYADIPKTDFAGESYTASISPNKGSPVRIKASVEIDARKKLNLHSDVQPTYQAPATVIMQLGKTDGKDVMIDDFYPNANYGSIDDLTVRSGSWIQRPLIEFDLNAVPAGVNIVSAILDLELRTVTTPGVIGVHRMTRSWEEGTGKGTGNADGATWNDYDGNAAWSQPGGDFDSTLYATAYVSSAKNGQRVTWEIRDLVDGWVSGRYPNYGLALVDDGVVNNAEFQSREEPDPAAAPRLTIVYACECGKTCGAAPPAGKNVLLVVGDTANLTVEQADKKALMEGWGHTVSLIATSASQAEFDLAADTVDVVYIPELGTTPMSELGDKADNLPKGVITEEARKAIKLGGFVLLPFVDTTSINILDNSHYLTETLPTGNVVLSTATQSFWKLGGTLAPDLHILGELTGSVPGLAYVDVGETVNDGSPAAGRRVKLPWGSYNFDVNLLTDDALEIMKRAIEWGAIGGPTQSVLLVVPDPTSLTAQDTAKQALIESWGFGVTLISHSATQGDFDTAIAASDVAYVSEEITTSELGTKLRDSTIGVVIEEQAITDEFGISSGNTVFTEGSIDITNNTHYITSPFSLGEIAFVASPQQVGAATGTLAPGLEILALQPSTSTGMLDVIETGGALYDSGTAAGRRVKLPWGGNDFDINFLTADGLTIMQRAIEWGAGVAAPAGPIAHWKLDDGTGLTAVDSEGGHDGTLTNGPVWVAGQLGDALDFDGVNDYVDVGAFDVSGSGLTLMAWFNAETIPTSDGRFISKASGPNDFDAFWQLSTTDSGSNRYLRMRVKAGGTTTTNADSTVNLTTGQWYFAAGTYDNASGMMRLYLEGTEIANRLHAVGGPVDTAPTVPVAIGANGTAERFFDGILDDVRVYDRALSATEISDLYTAGGGGGGGGGGSCDGNFRDNFDARAFNGSNGTLSWATDWLEVGESNGPTSGDIQVMENLSAFVLRTRDNDNGGEGVEREADLSGATTATLNYDYRRMNLDSTSDYTSVEVSANGASGPWTELTRHSGSGNDSSYQPASHNITAYKSANTRVRFITSSSMGGTDTVWFDNIEIACTP